MVLALSAVLMGGCVNGPGGHGHSLAEGHYLILGRFDVDYVYEQYFVVRPDNRYEWVEYGSNAATNEICKVTRHAGTYELGETRLELVRERDAGPAVECGFSAADFRAMKWKEREEPLDLAFEIREVDGDGFEAKDFFTTGGDFRALARKADPYGFYD
jgi:hypothetical protein